MKTKAQTELPLPERDLSTEDLRAIAAKRWSDTVQPLLAAAIHRLGGKECAVLFDSSPSYISSAVKEQQGKSIAADWLVALLVAAPDATKLEILTELNRIAGFRAPERRREMTAEEELRARMRAMRRLAPAVADLIDREIEES